MPAHSRSQDGVASPAYGVHVLSLAYAKDVMAGTSPAMTHHFKYC
jgi:hypothetical protein